MPQQFSQSHSRTETSSQEVRQGTPQPQKLDEADAQQDALDAVLDDISSTLESNAEQYVSSFVQKGGQ
ncbi:ubiquitin-like protein Pup [Bifidobacterium sp. ESL0790]|uniref:ubiquitin-like protein Pup n=1 Tax=Bifidobacterium sp. ESL0790 TaxID=2983233 RepID=UPI0023F6FCA3|nr:ubiquitin-like protein Pup [Bifidobacterium sp. ESL0790]WEV71877.1 ubiquitin-like protein Pup [Bifidobacterium sp. ESL0790]